MTHKAFGVVGHPQKSLLICGEVLQKMHNPDQGCSWQEQQLEKPRAFVGSGSLIGSLFSASSPRALAALSCYL